MLACLLFCAALASAASARYAGRPLADVLQELAGPGLRLVYNTEIVPPALRVEREPDATGGVALVRELLAAHGLALERVGPETWAVVRGAAAPAAAPPKPLDETGRELADVVVSASRYGLATDLPETHVFLTQAQIERLPKLADEPLRAIHRLPGAATNGLSGLAHIRGGEEGETQVLLDGMPLYEPFHLRNFLSPVSVLDARAIGSLDVYTGAFPAQYGERMSAVVVASTREAPSGREQEVGASLFHANALSAGTFADGRGDWLASVRHSYVGVLTELAHSDYGEPQYGDALLRLRRQLDERTTLALTVLHGRDDISIDKDFESASAKYHNDYAWLTLDRRWSERLRTTAIASYTEVDSERSGVVDEPGQRTGEVFDERVYHAWGLKVDAELDAGAAVYRAGFEARSLGAHYDYSSRSEFSAGYPTPPSPAKSVVRDLDTGPKGTQSAAYASARWRPLAAVTVDAGLRWEAQDLEGIDADVVLSPRLNVLWDAAPGWRLRASAGRFHQVQGINELQVEDGVTRFFPAQHADHYVLGLEHPLATGPVLRAEAYLKKYGELRARYENLLDPLALLPELEADRVRIAPSAAEARGIELLLSSAPGAAPWRWWGGYTFATVRDRIDGVDVQRSWDQRHAVTAGVDWSAGRWDVSVALTAHEGWPTTALAVDPATGALLPTRRNAERFRTFASLDFRASRRFALGGGELQAYVEATNATARRNPCCVDYEVVGGPGAWSLESDERIWPRIIPSLGVLYTWK